MSETNVKCKIYGIGASAIPNSATKLRLQCTMQLIVMQVQLFRKALPSFITGVAFPRNFFIAREAATAERRYEKERQSVNYVHIAAFSARTRVFSPLLALPLPLSQPPPINAIRGADLRLFPPPLPLTPPEDCDKFLAISAKVKDSLHLGAQKCCSWIWTAIVIMYEFSVQW
jgi:hypothetical protein